MKDEPEDSSLRSHPSSFQGRRFRPYSEYRESGVEWLGLVPAHWKTDRLKWTVTMCRNGIWGGEPDGVNNIACVRVADFDRTRFVVQLKKPTIRSVAMGQRAGRLLSNGDLLLEKSGGGELQPVGAVTLFDHDREAVCSNFVARMPVTTGFDGRFLAYFHAHLYSGRVNTRSIKQTTGIQNLDSDSYLNEHVPFIPLDEQRAIAAFLDRETGRIDELIAKKQRLIELLAEKRTALISHAVTKGLNPDAPMKESGIDWLGLVPQHWDVCKTKRVARLRSGHTPSRQHPEYWIDCTIPWFTLADVWQLRDGRREYLGDTEEKISPLGLRRSAAQLLPAGTVIVSRTASVGFSGIMPVDMATTQDFVNWVCGPTMMPEYLLYVFRGMSQEFRRLTMGSTHKTIYMPDVWQFTTPVPPLDEQGRIVAFIRKNKAVVEELEDLVSAAIRNLREYRVALVSAAVTGKIDVRERMKAEG